MLWQFSAVELSPFSFIYIYRYILESIFFAMMVYHRILNIVCCDTSRTWLLIPSLYQSSHLLTPTSHSILPHHLPPW